MDRLTTISASFFMAADIFAIISLATPDWIVTDVGGKIDCDQNNTLYLFCSLELISSRFWYFVFVCVQVKRD